MLELSAVAAVNADAGIVHLSGRYILTRVVALVRTDNRRCPLDDTH